MTSQASFSQVAAGVLAALCTAFVLWKVPELIAARHREHVLTEYLILLLMVLPAATGALLGWLYAFTASGSRARTLARLGCAGALLVGGPAFLAGFLGPLLLTPESNQGPLLGIFVTGPLGLVLGAVAGVLWGLGRRTRP
jgi:hypothetical protein